MINPTQRRVVRLILKPQLRIPVLIQIEPVDYFARILAAQGSLIVGMEWKHTPRFDLSHSSVIVAGWHGLLSIFGSCYTILMLSSWWCIYRQGSSQMLFLLDREKNYAYP